VGAVPLGRGPNFLPIKKGGHPFGVPPPCIARLDLSGLVVNGRVGAAPLHGLNGRGREDHDHPYGRDRGRGEPPVSMLVLMLVQVLVSMGMGVLMAVLRAVLAGNKGFTGRGLAAIGIIPCTG
jgi:hypothetical protein